VTDPDDDDDENMGTLLIALMQKERRKKRKEGLDMLTIGYAVYKVNLIYVLCLCTCSHCRLYWHC